MVHGVNPKEDVKSSNVAYTPSPSMAILASRQASEHELRIDDDEDSSSISSRFKVEGKTKATVLDSIAAARASDPNIEAFKLDTSIEEDDHDLFEHLPEPYLQATNYQKIIISASEDDLDPETQDICKMLEKCIALRKRFLSFNDPEIHTDEEAKIAIEPHTGSPFVKAEAGHDTQPGFKRRREKVAYDPFHEPKIPEKSQHTLKMIKGVVQVYLKEEILIEVPTVEEFYEAYLALKKFIHSGPAKTLAFQRLKVLEARFNLHTLLNSDRELMSQKSVPHRDFYNVRKVDTHVHHSASMNQKHLLRFIKSKLRTAGGEVVIFRDGRFLTLSEVFRSLHLTAYDLSVDTLDCHANNTFHRFDRFNLKYNPAGQSRLREIFLKTDNFIGGKYLADITKEVMADLEASKYQLVEWRVSIYGRKQSEWDKLSRWFYVNRLASEHVRWMIQIPRLYFVYKKTGAVECFQDMLDNIFLPMFQVTLDPSSNPELFVFLQTIVGFDCVDDESKIEQVRVNSADDLPPPSEWTSDENPPYDYWCYYIYANLASLNAFRRSKGWNTFTFRPHCGEAGDPDHLTAAFLTANGINHGITLRKTVVMQYLYYLTQIGVAMSPLSNNKLFLEYHRNPFPVYFARGLNVSLSSDDPLMLHYTKDALVEEYSVAAQVWKLSATDICEIARYSVLQSGFEHPFKVHFLGEKYYLAGSKGNDIRMTNVPDIRINYRHETLQAEQQFISSHCE